MDDYENIEESARHRDWQGCARIMFRLLFRFPAKEQRSVARAALCMYVHIWREKHDSELKQVPDYLLANGIRGERPTLPEFPEDLDPADAEFENGLLEFYNGTFFPGTHPQHTMHFATAVRSAVTAMQINRWLRAHPDDYAKWKAGSGFNGPTFLDDEEATAEAQVAWKYIADLLKAQPPKSYRLWRPGRRIEQFYQDWEATIL
jgi:hypothetical protein